MPASSPRVSAEDRRQQIIEIATELFARQGYEGTTTRHIAEHASVNEAIIFRHFPTKEDLYWAVIEHQCSMRGRQEKLEQALASSKDDAELLTTIGEDLLNADTILLRLLLFSALERHELSHRFFKTRVASYYELLADHIRRGISQGRFRDVDPLLAARGFLGMIIYHYQIQELFGGKLVQSYEHREVVRTLVEIWLSGMRRTAG